MVTNRDRDKKKLSSIPFKVYFDPIQGLFQPRSRLVSITFKVSFNFFRSFLLMPVTLYAGQLCIELKNFAVDGHINLASIQSFCMIIIRILLDLKPPSTAYSFNFGQHPSSALRIIL